jgi:glutaredoxin 2
MKLYVYDHCPYCVKARMIFGYKKINFELITLLNDDEKTPTEMIGSKMVPILTLNDGTHMAESLDIIKKVDDISDSKFLSDEKFDFNLEVWLGEARAYLYPLAMPRWVKVGLEEFKTEAAVDYFTKKKEDKIGSFGEQIARTAEHIKNAEEHLEKLELLLPDNGDFYLGDEASINDIHLFPTLRSLSVVKDLDFPSKVYAYIKKQEKFSGVNLHLNIAI